MSQLTQAQKQEWIDALRSNRFPQIRNAMFKYKIARYAKQDEKIGFCCLGVAQYIFSDNFKKHFDIFKSCKEAFVLRDMNDSGASFAEIADWIEQNVSTDD